MKAKLVISACLIFTLFYNCSFAQRDKKNLVSFPVGNNYSPKTPTDTLMPLSFSTGTATLYNYIEGGYAFGINALSDRAFAQVYKVTTSYIVDGVAIWIGAKKQVGTADTLNFIIYKLDGPGEDTSGIVNNAPDSTDHLLTITTDLLDTAGLTFIPFVNPYIAYVDYAAGIDLSRFNDDTIGLVTTTDGDAGGSQLSWNKWSDSNWHTVLQSINWGMDLDLGIFMIVDNSSANISDNYFVDQIKLSQNQPNPASGSALIQYAIEKNANVKLEIYDLNGRLVVSCNEGMQTAGNHNISLEVGKLQQGTYYYSLKADNHRLTKKMTIIK